MEYKYDDFTSQLNDAVSGKLAEKTAELQKLAESEDAKRLQSKFSDPKAILAALEQGDGAALEGLFNSLMNSEEGMRLAEQLSKMIK